MFPVAAVDTRAKPGTRLRVYTTLGTSSAACKEQLPLQQRLKDELANENVDLIAIPVDEQDDNNKLAAFNREWHPPVRLVNIPPERRKDAAAAFTRVLGEEPPLPSTVITDGAGRVLGAEAGVPSVSTLRKLLGQDR
jgi:hypothetical protein